MDKRDTRSIEEISVKQIGIQVPLPLHEEFREAAKSEGLSGSALLKKLVVGYLDRRKK